MFIFETAFNNASSVTIHINASCPLLFLGVRIWHVLFHVALRLGLGLGLPVF
jgi:hypothetical protein